MVGQFQDFFLLKASGSFKNGTGADSTPGGKFSKSQS